MNNNETEICEPEQLALLGTFIEVCDATCETRHTRREKKGIKAKTRTLVDRVAIHRNSRKLREEKLHFKQTLLNECGASKT